MDFVFDIEFLIIVGKHIKQRDQRHVLLELQMERGLQEHLGELREVVYLLLFQGMRLW